MTKADAILQAALALDESERSELAGLLLKSIEPPAEAQVEAAWGDEVRRRVAKIESGQAKLVSWEEVREQLVRRLNGRLQRAVAANLFETGTLSLAQGAKLAGLSIEEFVELLGREEVVAVDYPPEELAEELQAAR